MLKYLFMVLALCAVWIPSSESSAQDKTCTERRSACEATCKQPRALKQNNCQQDCVSRWNVCLQTGEFLKKDGKKQSSLKK